MRPGSPTAQLSSGAPPRRGGAAEHIPHPDLPESSSEAGLHLSHVADEQREAQGKGPSPRSSQSHSDARTRTRARHQHSGPSQDQGLPLYPGPRTLGRVSGAHGRLLPHPPTTAAVQRHQPDGKCPQASTVKALVPAKVSFLLSASVSPHSNKNLTKVAVESLPGSDSY